MKKRIVIASILGLVMAMAMGVPAMAKHTPQETHHHHIILPNGNCVEAPAIHRAAQESPVLQHGGC